MNPVFLLGCYGCIFHGTGNSAQLCQNLRILGGGGGGGFEPPEPTPSVRHWSLVTFVWVDHSPPRAVEPMMMMTQRWSVKRHRSRKNAGLKLETRMKGGADNYGNRERLSFFWETAFRHWVSLSSVSRPCTGLIFKVRCPDLHCTSVPWRQFQNAAQ